MKTTKIGPLENLNFLLHSNSFVLDSSTHVCVLVSFNQGEQSLEVVHCQYCQYSVTLYFVVKTAQSTSQHAVDYLQ